MAGMRFTLDDLRKTNVVADDTEYARNNRALLAEVEGEGKQCTGKGKRNHKYNAVKKEVDKITFASTGEANRYIELKRQASLGLIQHDKEWLQVLFVLESERTNEHGFKHRKVRYLADFVYKVGEITVVEDFKGYRTAEFKRKEKMLEKMFKGTKTFLWVNSDVKALFTPHIHLLENSRK